MRIAEVLRLFSYGTEEGAEKRGVGKGSRGGQADESSIGEDIGKGHYSYDSSDQTDESTVHHFEGDQDSPAEGKTIHVEVGDKGHTSVYEENHGGRGSADWGDAKFQGSKKEAANYVKQRYGISKIPSSSSSRDSDVGM